MKLRPVDKESLGNTFKPHFVYSSVVCYICFVPNIVPSFENGPSGHVSVVYAVSYVMVTPLIIKVINFSVSSYLFHCPSLNLFMSPPSVGRGILFSSSPTNSQLWWTCHISCKKDSPEYITKSILFVCTTIVKRIAGLHFYPKSLMFIHQ